MTVTNVRRYPAPAAIPAPLGPWETALRRLAADSSPLSLLTGVAGLVVIIIVLVLSLILGI